MHRTMRQVPPLVLIVASICMISNQSALQGRQNAAPSSGQKGWLQLDLDSTKLAGATVYYEKCFEPNLPIFENEYKSFLTDKNKNTATTTVRDQIISEINQILGTTEPNVPRQRRLLSQLLDAFPVNKVTFYLIRQATIKDFMRAGGQLPDCTYEKETDTVLYNFQLRAGSDEGPLREFEMALPVGPDEPFREFTHKIFQMLRRSVGSGVLGVAVHEVAEASLLMRAKPSDPYWRWFSDGVAETIRIELSRKYAGPENPKEFMRANDPNEYKDLENEINLRYWMSLNFCVLGNNTPIEYENRLSYARYAYAAFEAQRLIELHGFHCVRKILDEVCRRQSRTSSDLLEAIKEVTGEDMEKALARYQTFRTRKEGIAKYAGLFKAAAKEKDRRQMLINLLRMHELRQDEQIKDFMLDYKNAALLLLDLGYEEAADGVMHNCLALFENHLNTLAHEAAMEIFAVYSIQCGRPEKAALVAGELLKRRPDDVPALVVQMLNYANAGRLKEAKDLAKKIQALVKDERSQSYRIAARVLAKDPNQPDPKQ